jgi:hypothetical protein
MRNSVKRYPDHSSCAHAWAHQHSDEGQANNFFFRGTTIYSYGTHFPIATIDGDRVFFTDEKYSKSTSKHKSIVYAAISHLEIIHVEGVPTQDQLSSPEAFIDKNINYWLYQINKYATEFEINPRKKSLLKSIDDVLCRIKTFVKALEIIPSKELQVILDSPSSKAISAYRNAEKLKAQKAEKKRKAKLLVTFTKSLADWRTGKIQRLGQSHPVDANLAYLRLNLEKQVIETSKNVPVPLEVAKRFYKFILNVLPEGCVPCSYSIMDFKVKSITTESIVIGCHTIAIAEVKQVAALLGWNAEECP